MTLTRTATKKLAAVLLLAATLPQAAMATWWEGSLGGIRGPLWAANGYIPVGELYPGAGLKNLQTLDFYLRNPQLNPYLPGSWNYGEVLRQSFASNSLRPPAVPQSTQSFSGYAGQAPATGIFGGPLFPTGLLNYQGGGSFRFFGLEGGKEELQRASAATANPLAARIAAIERQRGDYYFRDQTLFRLRQEWSEFLTQTLLRDPWIAYTSYWISTTWDQVRKQQPLYRTVTARQEEIRRWRPVTDPALLLQRYEYRAQLEREQLLLEEQVGRAIEDHQETANLMKSYLAFLQTRQFEIMSSAAVRTALERSSTRYNQAVAESTAARILDAAYRQLLNDFPALQRYQELAVEGSAILQSLSAHPATVEYFRLASATYSDPYVIAIQGQLSTQYNDRIQLALNSTRLRQHVERFLELEAGYIAGDAGLRWVEQEEAKARNELANYLKRVFDAVNACHWELGARCNAYSDSRVLSVTSNANHLGWLRYAASLTENRSTAEYNFGVSSSYQTLAGDFQQLAGQEIAKVGHLLTSAAENHRLALLAVPQIRRLSNAWSDLMGVLFREKPRLAVVLDEMDWVASSLF